MSAKHLILGWIKNFPSHGYMIKKCYQEFINPAQKLNDAQLYPLLREMEEEGLVKREIENRVSAPSRKIIKITKRGEAEFENWLRSNSGETYEDRPRYDFFRAFPFLGKFAFFYELDSTAIVKKLSEQHAIHSAKLDDFRQAKKEMKEKGLQRCKIQAIDFGIKLEETILMWLEEMLRYYRKNKSKTRRAYHAPQTFETHVSFHR